MNKDILKAFGGLLLIPIVILALPLILVLLLGWGVWHEFIDGNFS